ncbi:MAG: Salicylate biosynthesis isochorismate synthase [Acidimicrobiales bacterium AG-410-I20]|nr:MAG: Salicylate biosynthesis isochorismate synthase [Acidimicrobiales bacterium AG-410-I20]
MALTNEDSADFLLTASTVQIPDGPACDPLSWFQSFPESEQRWFWENPDEDSSWVGIGCAATHCVSGSDRFADAAKFADHLFRDLAIEGPEGAPLPRVAAGFSFEEENFNELWKPLSAGRITLPAMQVVRKNGKSWLTTINNFLETPPNLSPPPPLTPKEVDPALWSSSRSRAHYRRLVKKALENIRAGNITKAVPCRSISIPTSPDLTELLSTLRNLYPACVTFGVNVNDISFVAATPERLAAVENGKLHTAALAGSAPRHPEPATDAILGQGLITSPKEQSEHGVVVEAIDSALSALGIATQHPSHPELLKLHGIQHLFTPITAELTAGIHLLDIISALHPTPAVSGYPVAPSSLLRSEYEELDRGWFASPVGWFDSSGNGEFRVALRSALITNNKTTLYAGAGVVEGSDPDRELLETDIKLSALLGPILASEGHQHD